jgi:hypothetical protein
MKKVECDRCGEIHDPSESKTIKFERYPCEIEVCPDCWSLFTRWAKVQA